MKGKVATLTKRGFFDGISGVLRRCYEGFHGGYGVVNPKSLTQKE